MAAAGMEAPRQRLASKPALRADVVGYYEGFLALSRQREFNPAGVQALRFIEIDTYCRVFGIAPGDPQRKFTRLVLALDNAYLSLAAKKAEADRRNRKTT